MYSKHEKPKEYQGNSWRSGQRRSSGWKGRDSGSQRNLSQKQQDFESGALGTRWETKLDIPGPHYELPKELEERGSEKSKRLVLDKVNKWVNGDEDRKRLCVMSTPDKSGGIFIRAKLKSHYEELKKLGKNKPTDSMTQKQLMAVIAGCADCFSLDHGGCPQQFCPNAVRMKRYDIALKEGNPDGMLDCKRLKERQKLDSSDPKYIAPCDVTCANGFKCLGIGHDREDHRRSLEDGSCMPCSPDEDVEGMVLHSILQPLRITGRDGEDYILCLHGCRHREGEKGSSSATAERFFSQNWVCVKYCLAKTGFHRDPFSDDDYTDKVEYGMGVNIHKITHVGPGELRQRGHDQVTD